MLSADASAGPVDLEAVGARTSFVQLPAWLAAPLLQRGNVTSLVLRLDFDEDDDGDASEPRGRRRRRRHVHVAWMGEVSSSRAIAVSSLLADALGLRLPIAGACVRAATLQPAARVDVEPVGADDWELISSQPGYLEGELLNQLCVVSPGLRLAVTLHASTVVRLRVTACEPAGLPALRLVQGTELVVAPRARAAAVKPQTRARRARAAIAFRVQSAGGGAARDERGAAHGALGGGSDPLGQELLDPFEVAAAPDVCARLRAASQCGLDGCAAAGARPLFCELHAQRRGPGGVWAPVRVREGLRSVCRGHVALGAALCATLGVEQGDELYARALGAADVPLGACVRASCAEAGEEAADGGAGSEPTAGTAGGGGGGGEPATAGWRLLVEVLQFSAGALEAEALAPLRRPPAANGRTPPAGGDGGSDGVLNGGIITFGGGAACASEPVCDGVGESVVAALIGGFAAVPLVHGLVLAVELPPAPADGAVSVGGGACGAWDGAAEEEGTRAGEDSAMGTPLLQPGPSAATRWRGALVRISLLPLPAARPAKTTADPAADPAADSAGGAERPPRAPRRPCLWLPSWPPSMVPGAAAAGGACAGLPLEVVVSVEAGAAHAERSADEPSARAALPAPAKLRPIGAAALAAVAAEHEACVRRARASLALLPAGGCGSAQLPWVGCAPLYAAAPSADASAAAGAGAGLGAGSELGSPCPGAPRVVGVDAELAAAEACVRGALGRPFARVGLGGALLVHAAPGGGRSAFVRELCARVREPASAAEPAAHIACLSCAQLARVPHAAALAALRAALGRASARAPALLVLDDLHLLAPAEAAPGSAASAADGAPSAAEAARGALFAELLSDWLRADARAPPSSLSAGGGFGGSGLVVSLGERVPRVAVVATCAPGLAALHAALGASGCFSTAVQLPPLDAPRRALLLQSALGVRGAAAAPTVAARVGAYLHELGASHRDVVSVAHSAAHAAVSRATSRAASARAGGGRGKGSAAGGAREREAPLRVRRCDWERACAAFVPASTAAAGAGGRGGVAVRQRRAPIAWAEGGARGGDAAADGGSGSDSGGSSDGDEAHGAVRDGAASAAAAGAAEEPGWAEVGGLEEARRVLREAVELPARHPALFAALPLRPRSGVLLYGPPGCGKSLLAQALARATRLRILTVKGPELLDKYIGASEAAVRRTFEAAAAAAPSILFLDEFDSLAPRRGADSTGVTDRVVNQLLCQLDGIEALHGVAVLAASTRPELIDPALLRPGRLDRRVYCGLPDAGARAHVLARALRGFELAPEAAARLLELAEACAGFSGADVHALAYQAQLELLRGEEADGGGGLGALAELGRGGASDAGDDGGSSAEEAEEGGAEGAPQDGRTGWPPPPWAQPLLTRPSADARAAGAPRQNGGGTTGDEPPAAARRQQVMTYAHLLAALRVTRPSLAPRELALYERAYAQFAG